MKLIFRKTHEYSFQQNELNFLPNQTEGFKNPTVFILSQNENYMNNILYNIKSSMY